MTANPVEGNMRTWRLLDLPPMTAAENMALDDVLLELRGQGKGENSLRFLQFHPHAVLVGFHQSVQEEVNLPYCREHGIDVNRRITGGGGLLFDENQIGWEIVCGKAFFDVGLPTDALFRRLCEPTVAALRGMGIDAGFRPRNDIEVAGRKISGTGGTDSGDAFLFQGTLLVDFDVETMLRCLRVSIEKLKAREIDSVRQRVTCLAWELGRIPSGGEVKTALSRTFEEHLGIRLERCGLTDEEQRLLAERLPYFRSQEWIDMVRPEYERTGAVQETYKSPAGLVRFTLVVNLPQKILKTVYITGDFFVSPSRALFDLEAALRGKPLDGKLLCGIVDDFFASGRISISGMNAEDLRTPLVRALNRVEAMP
ncbi:MAG: lipoate--protein ligase family protein [Desulfovibrio sp.]|jgi:lipoate-protein ligase A|nr:lipoate--protein ligase family protein [Desulfovibrio sp.]